MAEPQGSPLPENLARVRAILAGQPDGRIEETGALEQALAACWDDLEEESNGRMCMPGSKLRGRVKEAEWRSPELSFTVERHGGTVLGSTRAELQRWTVNLDRGVKSGCVSGHRQLEPTAPRVDLRPLARQAAEAVRAGSQAPFLRWLEPGTRVRVVLSEIVPSDVCRQTLSGRNRHFRSLLAEELRPEGWIEDRAAMHCVFERPARVA